MADLTPEQKQEMIERAARPSGLEQAAADRGALRESTEVPIQPRILDADLVAAEQARVNSEAAATAAADAARIDGAAKTLPTKPTTAPSYVAGNTGAVDQWGPYDDYVIVTTPYGQFAVPKGEILHFEQTQTFSNRARGMVTVHVPRYRDAATGLTRDPISGNYYDPSLTSTALEATFLEATVK